MSGPSWSGSGWSGPGWTAPGGGQTWRGWRFVHPDLDAAGPEQGASGPGMIGLGLSPRGGAAMTSGAALVRQSLLMLLSTVPGERVMRPEYGCWLSRLLFAPNDDTTAGLAMHYVRQAIDRFEPRARIVRLDASPDPLRPSLLRLDLSYRVPGLGVQDDLRLDLDLSGGSMTGPDQVTSDRDGSV